MPSLQDQNNTRLKIQLRCAIEVGNHQAIEDDIGKVDSTFADTLLQKACENNQYKCANAVWSTINDPHRVVMNHYTDDDLSTLEWVLNHIDKLKADELRVKTIVNFLFRECRYDLVKPFFKTLNFVSDEVLKKTMDNATRYDRKQILDLCKQYGGDPVWVLEKRLKRKSKQAKSSHIKNQRKQTSLTLLLRGLFDLLDVDRRDDKVANRLFLAAVEHYKPESVTGYRESENVWPVLTTLQTLVEIGVPVKNNAGQALCELPPVNQRFTGGF